jgi:hypothetical protein
MSQQAYDAFSLLSLISCVCEFVSQVYGSDSKPVDSPPCHPTCRCGTSAEADPSRPAGGTATAHGRTRVTIAIGRLRGRSGGPASMMRVRVRVRSRTMIVGGGTSGRVVGDTKMMKMTGGGSVVERRARDIKTVTVRRTIDISLDRQSRVDAIRPCLMMIGGTIGGKTRNGQTQTMTGKAMEGGKETETGRGRRRRSGTERSLARSKHTKVTRARQKKSRPRESPKIAKLHSQQ